MSATKTGAAPPQKRRPKRKPSKPLHDPCFCALCREWCTNPTKHHLQYAPPVTVYVHRSCHDRMHGRKVFNDTLTRRVRAEYPDEWRGLAPLIFAFHVTELYERHLVAPIILGLLNGSVRVKAIVPAPPGPTAPRKGNGNGNGKGGETVH